MVKIKALLAKIVANINTLNSKTAVSTTYATVNSNITASRAQCQLLKIGNTVFITIAMGNITSSVNTNTTLFTVPTGYRPSSEATVQGYVGSAEGNFTISTAGIVRQTLTSSVQNCYAAGFYTV